MQIHYFEELSSTNSVAGEAARDGAHAYYTVWAKSQTAGRGRLERRFCSPVGGTYFSTVLRPVLSREEYTALTPFAALAVHRAIAELTGIKTDIKWVNDLYHNGKKICGILAESGTDKQGAPFVILGIGINTGKEPLPPEIADIAGNLPFEDPRRLIERVLMNLSAADAAIRRGDWIEEYRTHCLWRGELVRVMNADTVRIARMLDVASDGALLVEWEDGKKEALYGGEISLRSAQNGEI